MNAHITELWSALNADLPQIFVSPPRSPWLVPFSPPGTGTSPSARWSLFVWINRDQYQSSGDGEHSEMTDQTCKHFSVTASLFPPQAAILLSCLSFLSPGYYQHCQIIMRFYKMRLTANLSFSDVKFVAFSVSWASWLEMLTFSLKFKSLQYFPN